MALATIACGETPAPTAPQAVAPPPTPVAPAAPSAASQRLVRGWAHVRFRASGPGASEVGVRMDSASSFVGFVRAHACRDVAPQQQPSCVEDALGLPSLERRDDDSLVGYFVPCDSDDATLRSELDAKLRDVRFTFTARDDDRLKLASASASFEEAPGWGHRTWRISRAALRPFCRPTPEAALHDALVVEVVAEPAQRERKKLVITSAPPGAQVVLMLDMPGETCPPGSPMCGEAKPLGATPITYEYEQVVGEESPLADWYVHVSKPGYRKGIEPAKCCEMHFVLRR